jgi:alkylhydroperoxidase family enzyme
VTEDTPTTRPLRALAPDAFAAWDEVVASVPVAIGPARARDVEALVVALLDPSRADAGAPARPHGLAPVVAEFAEQFVLDVSSCTDEQRTAAMAELGGDAFPFVQVLYVADLGTRMRAAWHQLLGTDPGTTVDASVELWPALESFMSTVARMEALDPLTTEIVRLRGARAHNCRLCKSLRNVRAANDGADETVYDAIDHFETSTLSARHQVALRLVDAMLWQPTHYPEDLAPALRSSFTDGEIAELVLDVVRNAANKIAVAFGADQAHVSEGVEFYDVDDRGELVYGLTPSR